MDSSVQTREGFALKEQKPRDKFFENRKLAGRFFTKEENLEKAKVTVINQTLAKNCSIRAAPSTATSGSTA